MRISHDMQREVCQTLGLPPENVRTIHMTPSGGYVELICEHAGRAHTHPHQDDELCTVTEVLEVWTSDREAQP